MRPHGDERKKALEKAVDEMPSEHLQNKKAQRPAATNANVEFAAKKCKLFTTRGSIATKSGTEKKQDHTKLDEEQ